MSTEATTQVPADSVDAAGVSLVTSTRTVAYPGRGAIYDPASLAAGVPVWFHRLQDGRYIALYARHWTNATLSATTSSGPQLYTSHTVSEDPVWVTIHPTTGQGDGASPIPSNLDGVRTLTAAVSFGEYLFTLGTLGDGAIIQFFRVSRTGQVILQGEETVPLDFSLGLFVADAHLYVYGADAAGHLARIRKSWGRIGTNADPDRQWEYDAGIGWLKDPDTITPLLAPTGHLPADGPCSVVTVGDKTYLMTTEHDAGSGDWWGRLYVSRAVDPTWTQKGDPIPLGADTTYLGGAAYLQPQLPVNPAYSTPGTIRQIPCVTAVKVDVDTRSAILTEWSTVAAG